MMLTNKEMADRGYSKAFRCCFDLLAKYADAIDEPTTWEHCCAEATGIYGQFKNESFAPMVSLMLQAVFNEIGRIYDPGERRPAQTGKGEKYKFTL